MDSRMKKYDQTFTVPFTTFTGRKCSLTVEAASEEEAINFTMRHPSCQSVKTAEGATVNNLKG